VSGSTANDLAWSPDGESLLVALERDPVSHEGDILCIRLSQLQARFGGDTAFPHRRTQFATPAFGTRDVHLEMLHRQLSKSLNGKLRRLSMDSKQSGQCY
jgi:hypothetical protein